MRRSLLGRFPALCALSLDDTAKMGRELAAQVFPGLLISLSGDLGAGKTALVQAIASPLGVRGVKSPTFATEMIHQMANEAHCFVHVDLYRVENVSYLSLQLEEHLEEGALLCVEWGERWTEAPTENRWDISIEKRCPHGRSLDLSAWGGRALAALSRSYTAILSALKEEGPPCR